jgi:hypothetical protein
VAIPTLNSVQPSTGPSSGGDLVRLTGTGFSNRVQVLFGDASTVVSVRDEAGMRIADVHTPAHMPGVVAIELQNLDIDDNPVPGEGVVVPNA